MRPKNHTPDRCPALTCLQSPDPHQRRAVSCPSCPAAGRHLALRLLPGQPAGHLAPYAAVLPGQLPEKGGQRRPSARPAGCRDSASRAASSHRALGSTAVGAPHLHGGRRQPSCVWAMSEVLRLDEGTNLLLPIWILLTCSFVHVLWSTSEKKYLIGTRSTQLSTSIEIFRDDIVKPPILISLVRSLRLIQFR
jgi:hypothetical protein